MLQLVGIYTMVYLFVSIDLVFCGLCIYITAMYKELQRKLRLIDTETNNLEFHDEKEQYIRKSLRDSIMYHLAIIK